MRRGRFFRVYSANHPFEAHFVRTVLESHGVWATVQNENLAPYGVGAEVWVESDQIEAAREVLEVIQRDDSGQLSIVGEEDERGRLATAPPDEPALCPGCGRALSSSSEACPDCGERG